MVGKFGKHYINTDNITFVEPFEAENGETKLRVYLTSPLLTHEKVQDGCYDDKNKVTKFYNVIVSQKNIPAFEKLLEKEAAYKEELLAVLKEISEALRVC